MKSLDKEFYPECKYFRTCEKGTDGTCKGCNGPVGSVNTLTPDDKKNILIDDGHAQLGLVKAEHVHLGDDIFGFCAIDGGGFTGIIVTVEQWEEMKRKVDNYVKTLRRTNE